MTGMVPPEPTDWEIRTSAEMTLAWHDADGRAPGCDGCRTATRDGCKQLAWAQATLAAETVAAG